MNKTLVIDLMKGRSFNRIKCVPEKKTYEAMNISKKNPGDRERSLIRESHFKEIQSANVEFRKHYFSVCKQYTQRTVQNDF